MTAIDFADVIPKYMRAFAEANGEYRASILAKQRAWYYCPGKSLKSSRKYDRLLDIVAEVDHLTIAVTNHRYTAILRSCCDSPMYQHLHCSWMDVWATAANQALHTRMVFSQHVTISVVTGNTFGAE